MKVNLLDHYQNSLEHLENSNISHPSLNQELALEILLTRDALSQALSHKIKPSATAILKIKNLDKKLKQNAEKLMQLIDLEDYRENFPKSPDAWWWYLDIYVEEKTKKTHPWNRFDWLARGFRVIVWTGNIAILGTLASLFLSSGSGFWGAVTIAFPSILSLLQAQSELTDTGKKGFDRLLQKLKIPQYFHEEAKLVSSLLMTGLLLVIWLSLPTISNRYKQEGKQAQDHEKLALAEEKYLKAIKLDSENLDAHYKLATLYEELQDFANAKKQYIIAAKGGSLDAYNNLAYWYIREDKNEEAVDLLNQSLKLLAKTESTFEQLTDEEKRNFQSQKYSLYKNWGWARFQQKRDADAKPYLLIAINIANNPKYQKSIRNPGAAFCIYSQVLQNQDQQSSQVKQNWQKCRQLIESRLAAGEMINPEEDQWLHEAKQQLR